MCGIILESMGLFHHKKEFDCEDCDKKFTDHTEFIEHEHTIHQRKIVKCECGLEFLHEKDRFDHQKEEHKKEMGSRSHRESYPGEYTSKIQDRVDEQTKRFSDNL